MPVRKESRLPDLYKPVHCTDHASRPVSYTHLDVYKRQICARLEQLGLYAAVVFYPEKLSVEQLYGTVRYLEGLQEFLFYVPGGTVISSEELKQEIPLMEGEEENREIYGRILREMKELLSLIHISAAPRIYPYRPRNLQGISM